MAGDGPTLERSVVRIVLLTVAVGVAFVVGAAPLFAATLAQPLPIRIGIAVAAVFPLAFPMGMLFPIGVRLIARNSEDLIPWAWATNGCFSVMGIFGTRITALMFGFSRALFVGLAVYLLVIVCVRIQPGARRSAPR
jgi:hypothetical protein